MQTHLKAWLVRDLNDHKPLQGVLPILGYFLGYHASSCEVESRRHYSPSSIQATTTNFARQSNVYDNPTKVSVSVQMDPAFIIKLGTNDIPVMLERAFREGFSSRPSTIKGIKISLCGQGLHS